eukprot:3832103-Rhodomonas_salina.2
MADLRKSKASAEIAEILCRKAKVPGFWEPTYVITYDECFDLLSFLPRHRVKAGRKHVIAFFKDNNTQEQLQDTITGLGKRKAAEQPEADEGPGYVYAAYSQGNGMKIGMTSRNDPMQRIRALNTCVRYPFQLVDLIRCGNPRDVEKLLHGVFASSSVGEHNREMFDISSTSVINTFNHVRQAAEALQASPEDSIDATKLQEHLSLQK